MMLILRNLTHLTYFFSEDSLKESSTKNKTLNEFFANVKVWIRENNLKKDLKYDDSENVKYLFN